MTTQDLMMIPVYARVGDAPECEIGRIGLDHTGQWDRTAIADLFIACGQYMHECAAQQHAMRHDNQEET